MSRPPQWTPPGQSAHIAGYDIQGGLIYVGRDLRSGVGTIEPALLNPALPVSRHEPDRQGHDLEPAPSYHLISPAARAAYLAWLAGERRRSDVPIGFVSLFFSGLERRVLVDMTDDPTVRPELPAIAAEVRRLRAVYGPANRSFDSSAGAFLDVLDLLVTSASRPGRGPADQPPAPRHDRWPVPMALRLGLARFAVTGTPVPADWARSWAWYHPSLFPRTPQTRCPQEFERLFAVRYTRRFAAGLLPTAAARPPIRIGYQPASPGLDTMILDRPDLPDVLEEPTATRELGALTDSVTDALTPYSRWLARTPGGLGSLAATALLPADLLDLDHGPLQQVLTWAAARLDGRSAAVVDFREFGIFWSTTDPARMSKDEAESLALVLSRVGLGVEPDVRFGGPALAAGPVVLFRLAHEDPSAPTPTYLGAATMLHLAAGIATAHTASGVHLAVDDAVSSIVAELSAEMWVPVAERSRLAARLRWLLTPGSAATRVERRVSALTVAERETAGRFLIGVATAGPPVGPETVTALTKAYRLLGLDPDTVYSRLHQRSIEPAGPATPGSGVVPMDGPVVVRRARAGPPGHLLPRTPPMAGTPSTGSSDAPDRRPRAGSEVRLSQESVTRKAAETEAVAILLAGIFTDDELVASAGLPGGRDAAVGAATPHGNDAGHGPGFLDEAHSRLLSEIATRSSWSRADFARAAAQHGVMPSGALEVINEAAMEAAGEPAVEGDDELVVNNDALRELLR